MSTTITPYQQQPNLAQALLTLSAQTQNTPGSESDIPAPSLPPAVDTLNLSASASGSDTDAAAAAISQQNGASAIQDPDEALTANNSAIAFILNQPGTALSAQSGGIGTSVWNTISGA